MSCRSYLPDNATCVGGGCVRRWVFTFFTRLSFSGFYSLFALLLLEVYRGFSVCLSSMMPKLTLNF